MILFVKSRKAPSSLARGVAKTRENCHAYTADPAAYQAGIKIFDITKKIYGTEVVKRQLKLDQNDKCAFCEAIFDANSAGDVEHYRPKGAVETEQGKLHPGYYWLGYNWSNLSYACTDCNGYRKRDRFPLLDEALRARSHDNLVADEEPLILDPYGAKDPRNHITFRGEIPVGLTVEGRKTIEILSLNRTKLVLARLRHLRELTLHYDSLQMLQNRANSTPDEIAHIARLEARLASAMAPDAVFSGASIDHLGALAKGERLVP